MGNQVPKDLQARLTALLEALPNATDLDSAYLLAEVACMCHSKLQKSYEAPADFWLDHDDVQRERLYGFLRDASEGISQVANDLWHLTDSEAAQ